MAKILVPSRRIWTRQPPGLIALARSGRITPPTAAAIPRPGGAICLSDRAFVEPFAKLSAATLNVIRDANGYAVDGTTSTTASCPLHSVGHTISGAFANAWDKPSKQVTFAAICLRRGTNSNGTSEVFTNGSANAEPYTAYGISLTTTNEIRLECSAGGTYRSLIIGTLAAGALSVIVGRYNGARLEGFLNGVKNASSTACTGDLIYPGMVESPGGPAIGNFYQYTASARSFAGSVYLVAVWDSALSDAEISELSANPWQLFSRRDRYTVFGSASTGLTSVYADSALTYYIRSLLSSDSGIQYAIRNAIYKDDAVGYYLRSAIAQNSEVGYVLRSAIAKDDAEAYKIRGLIQSDDAESYNVRGQVQSPDGNTYGIRGRVQTDVSASYEIQSSTSVASSNAVNYSVRGAVSASSLVGYSVRGSVQKDAASAYSVRSTVSRDGASNYAIAGAASVVYSDNAANYSVDGVIPACPSAESIAAAVVSALQGTTIPANIKQVNDVTVQGAGTKLNPWQPV